jgi:hypothetical protein
MSLAKQVSLLWTPLTVWDPQGPGQPLPVCHLQVPISQHWVSVEQPTKALCVLHFL